MVLDFVYYLIRSTLQSNYFIYFLFLVLLLSYSYENMTESSKKRKRNSGNGGSNETVAFRSTIDANWKKFLSSSFMMNHPSEKQEQGEKKEHFTGTFRRARKKKAKQFVMLSNNNLKKNNIDLQDNPKDHELPSETKLNLNNANTKLASDIARDVHKVNNSNKLTRFVALDCEMVGIGHEGNDNMLARVSIVNKFGDCIYDKYVKAREEVIDYRTSVSGIRREDMLNGEDFNVVQKEVADIIKGKVLVGHALSHDLSVLFLSHPKRSIRDTSKYKPFKQITKGSTPSLKRLAKEILGVDIQCGEHSSVDDARAVMQLYCTVAKKWENTLSQKRGYCKKSIEE